MATDGRNGMALSRAGLEIKLELGDVQNNGSSGILDLPDNSSASSTSVQKRGLDSRQGPSFDITQELDSLESELDRLGEELISKS